jgi:rubrerythrin
MDLNTAASVISYISRLEEESAKLYEEAAATHEALKGPFLEFAQENRKHEKNVKRAYYSVISDALETAFSFKGLSADVHIPLLQENCPVQDLLQASIVMEENIQDFYRRAAQSSKAFLADVPRAMEQVVKKRSKRIEVLKSLLQEVGG